MTTRSIVLRTAMMLLMSAAVPSALVFAPASAIAQGSGEIAAALAGDPAKLEANELRQRIDTLRQAVQSGTLKGGDRKAARDKIQALRAELQKRKAERQQAKEPEPQQQPSVDLRKDDRPQGGQKAKEQAGKQPKPGKDEKAQAQQGGKAAVSADVAAALADDRPSSALELQDLRQRMQTLRQAIKSGALSADQRRQAAAKAKSDRDEIQSRRAQRQEQDQEKAAGKGKKEQDKAAGKGKKDPEAQAETAAAPRGDINARAKALLADKKPARQLSEADLRKRLTDTRAVLATGKLSQADERALRKRLQEDRQALRGRVAEEEEKKEKKEEKAAGTEITTTTNVNVIIERRVPSDRLSERELNQRIRALKRALKEERVERRHLEVANHILEEDRRTLRQRLKRERDRRHEHLRTARARNELHIDFTLDFRPPPVIFAAEAGYEDVEHQLVAPPLRQPQRAYSFEEIATNDEVRQAMPGIEIDTLNFDFGSSEVRPEEVEKLDKIAEVIERIVAARPDEVFMLEGHTDAVGTDQANLALSQQRAQAVMEALVEFYAIDPGNLRVVGLGERFLRIPTPEPEEENRRVTVRRITPLLTGQTG